MIPPCEAFGLGALFGLCFVGASVLWHLLARPHVLLAWFREEDDPITPDVGTLAALRVATAALLFVVAAVAGAAGVLWSPGP